MKMSTNAAGRERRPWLEEDRELVRTMWIQGNSAGRIAQEFDGAYTRNAVIGLVHRMGLTNSTERKDPIRKKKAASGRPKRRPARAPAPAKPKERKAPRLVPAKAARRTAPRHLSIEDVIKESSFYVEPKTLMELRKDECRFPVTENSPHLFCGRRRRKGSPYCAKHALIARRRRISSEASSS